MKKIIIFLILLTIPFIVKANHIGDFYKDINITVNCSKCDPNEEPEVTFQLFADGEEVENARLVLNKNNNYKGVFKNLAVFKEGTFDEIKYEVKYLEDGKFRSLKDEELSYKKEKVSKWVQVLPEDIQAGHKYVFYTDNWNYEQNGRGKWAFITDLMGLEEATAEPDYKVINGKKSYYSLTTEPNPDWVWTVTKVPSTDLLYEGFENYWVLTNVGSKRMTLSGYNKGDWIDYVFKQTGKSDGYIAGEDAWYTTKVEFLPVTDELGRFVISSHNIINDVVRGTKYLGVDHFYMIKAQAEFDHGARVMAFEYVQDQIIETVYDIQINKVLCAEATNPMENPKTKTAIYSITIVFVTSFFVVLILAYRSKKLLNK